MLFGKKVRKGADRNIAMFVDGPNILRKEFGVDLDDLMRIVKNYGRVITGQVFLNQHAPEKLIEAVGNEGLETRVMLAGEIDADVDVSVAVAAVEAAYDDNIDIVCIVSRDADYLPAVQAIKRRGKKFFSVGTKPGFSKALQNAADYVELLPNHNTTGGRPIRRFNSNNTNSNNNINTNKGQ